jgi:hypothetical protein
VCIPIYRREQEMDNCSAATGTPDRRSQAWMLAMVMVKLHPNDFGTVRPYIA